MAEQIYTIFDEKKVMECRAKLAKKILTISKALGAVQQDGQNTTGQGYKFISYEQADAHLRTLEEKYGVQIVPEIIAHNEEEYLTAEKPAYKTQYKEVPAQPAKVGIRTTLDCIMHIIDAETGFQIDSRWCGADQDVGGKSFSQAITECCKRFKLKLYKISSKDDVDPDSKTTEGKDPKTKTAPPASKKEEQKAPAKKTRENPKDPTWKKLMKAIETVGNDIYLEAKEEASVGEIWTLSDAKAVLMAIDMVLAKKEEDDIPY